MARNPPPGTGENTRPPSHPANAMTEPPGGADDVLLLPREAAELCRCTVSNLARLRRDGNGPDWVGRNRPKYWRSAVIAWINADAHNGDEPFRRRGAAPPRHRVVNTPPKRGGSKPRATAPTETTEA